MTQQSVSKHSCSHTFLPHAHSNSLTRLAQGSIQLCSEILPASSYATTCMTTSSLTSAMCPRLGFIQYTHIRSRMITSVVAHVSWTLPALLFYYSLPPHPSRLAYLSRFVSLSLCHSLTHSRHVEECVNAAVKHRAMRAAAARVLQVL